MMILVFHTSRFEFPLTETHQEWHDRRLATFQEAERVMLERESMAGEDRSSSEKPMRKPKLHHHFVNTHPNPDELCQWDSNMDKQKTEPEWHCPYLKGAGNI